ncbi:ephrin-A1, partial [Columba livia]
MGGHSPPAFGELFLPTQPWTPHNFGGPESAPSGSGLEAALPWPCKSVYGGARGAPQLTATADPASLPPQADVERLRGGGASQRLPGHHLPALRGGQRGPPRHGALHALPGGARGVPGLQTQLQGADPLGVQQAQHPPRPREVLREVPALHPFHAGKGVQGGAQLLLYLQAHSPPWGRVPEAEGGGRWQRGSDAACPHPEGPDPGRRRGRARSEERGAELGDTGQQPLHLRQPPRAPAGAAGSVTWGLGLGTQPGCSGTPRSLCRPRGGPPCVRARKGFVSIKG